MSVDEQLARARLLDSAATLYLRRPDSSLLRACATACGALAEMIGAPALADRMADTDRYPLSTFELEYDALFCVPVSGRYLPPFESAQCDRRLWGPRAHAVARFYGETGFRLEDLACDPIWNSHPIPDHIGFEMAFLSALLQSEARAEASRAAHLRGTYALFRHEHFDSWATSYGTRLMKTAHTPLYQALGALTVGIAAREVAPA